MRTTRRSLAWLILLLALSGCGSGGVADQLTQGIRELSAEVQSVELHGPILDVVVTGEVSRRYFLSLTPECRAVAKAGAAVRISPAGPWGRLLRDEWTCIPSGIGSLRYWRNSRPRPGLGPLPRSRVSFQVVFSDEKYAFARGRFLLASAVGWSRGDDTVAVIPVSPECHPPLERGVASMQYHERGTYPFTLISDSGVCPILGFIRPGEDF